MKRFLAGVLFTLLILAGTVFAVSHFGLYPIGADNPPGGLERALTSRALDEYASRHKPAGPNPAQATSENLIEGAKEYEEHCAFCHGGAKAKVHYKDISIVELPAIVSSTRRVTSCSIFSALAPGPVIRAAATRSGMSGSFRCGIET